jgi:hypothetical protein
MKICISERFRRKNNITVDSGQETINLFSLSDNKSNSGVRRLFMRTEKSRRGLERFGGHMLKSGRQDLIELSISLIITDHGRNISATIKKTVDEGGEVSEAKCF